eukprot:7229573-Pyramimonas_sp.AAC.1
MRTVSVPSYPKSHATFSTRRKLGLAWVAARTWCRRSVRGPPRGPTAKRGRRLRSMGRLDEAQLMR